MAITIQLSGSPSTPVLEAQEKPDTETRARELAKKLANVVGEAYYWVHLFYDDGRLADAYRIKREAHLT